jgi:3D (Asp-Asp-Asp) domain-containing protein
VRKILVALAFIFILVLTGCGDNEASVKKYVKKNLGFEVNIISQPTIHTGNMGNGAGWTVQRTDIPELTFSVDTEGFFAPTIIGNDYKEMLGYYELNKWYLTSSYHDEIKKLGIDSFLSWTVSSYTAGYSPTDVTFIKKDALEISDTNFSNLVSAFSVVNKLNTELKTKGYNIVESRVADTGGKLVSNGIDYRTLVYDSGIEDIKLAKLETITDIKSLKSLIAVNSLNLTPMVERHNFLRDMPKVELLESQLSSSKVTFYKQKYGYFMSCRDGDKITTFDALNLSQCSNYNLDLALDAFLTDGVSDDEVNSIYNTIKAIQSTGLNVKSIFLKVNEDHPNSHKHDGVFHINGVDKITSKEEVKVILEKGAQEVKKVMDYEQKMLDAANKK